ncbi:MAG: PhoH family protein, partial [Coriobacteriia bacterium]|nr:PhoH family protein [Coriobacteriia bacterium]
MEPTQIRLVVPPELNMTELLGQGDDLLRVIEDRFESQISVRGNQITITGLPTEGQTVSSLFAEMITL